MTAKVNYATNNFIKDPLEVENFSFHTLPTKHLTNKEAHMHNKDQKVGNLIQYMTKSHLEKSTNQPGNVDRFT